MLKNFSWLILDFLPKCFTNIFRLFPILADLERIYFVLVFLFRAMRTNEQQDLIHKSMGKSWLSVLKSWSFVLALLLLVSLPNDPQNHRRYITEVDHWLNFDIYAILMQFKSCIWIEFDKTLKGLRCRGAKGAIASLT